MVCFRQRPFFCLFSVIFSNGTSRVFFWTYRIQPGMPPVEFFFPAIPTLKHLPVLVVTGILGGEPKIYQNLPKIYGCFLKWWYPQIIHFYRVFHYKPSILGYPYFVETPIYLQKGGGGGLGPSVRDEAVDFFSEL